MLTPDKIREKTFQTTGRGSYRAEDVDNFLDDVVVSYEQMFKENGDLIKKISILAKKVEEYRADEESLKLALLNAQKLADRIVAEAKENAEKENEAVKAETEQLRADADAYAQRIRDDAETAAAEMTANSQRESAAIVDSAKAEAEKIINEANRQSNEILGNINRKVTHESLVYEMVQKEASEFKGKLVAMYKEHINLINQLPEIADEKLDAAAKEEASEPTPAAAVEAEDDEVYTQDASPVEIEVEVEVEVEPEAETEEPAAEDISSSSEPEAQEEETAVADDEPEAIEKPVKAKPFKLDFSKIDFADDETVPAPAPEAAIEIMDEADDDDDSAAAISFKNFFKKK